MPPRMRTQSAGRPTTESLGGGTGVRVGRGRRGRRPREGNDERVDDLNGQGNDQGLGANRGNLLSAMLAQVSNRGNVGNENGNVVNENVQENVGNVIVNGNRVGCSYKEFLACNPKEYDGKGGVVVLTRWIEKMKSVHDMSGCSIDQKLKYTTGSFVGKALTHEMQKLESELWNHAMVGAGHAAYTDRFHELARLVPHLVTPESRMIERYVYGLAPQICGMVAATEPKTIQKAVQISGALTDEAVRNGSIKKVEKRGSVGEPSKDRSGRNANKMTRTVNAFATTINPVGRENTGTWPKCTIYNSFHTPGGLCHTCFNYNRLGHLAKDYRGVLRNVNPFNARNPTVRACYECGSTDHVRSAYPRLNRAQGLEENRPNQVAVNNEGRGRGNQGNRARGKAFMLGRKQSKCFARGFETNVTGIELNPLKQRCRKVFLSFDTYLKLEEFQDNSRNTKDRRELNKLTVKNCYPLPRIDDLFDQLQGSPFLKELGSLFRIVLDLTELAFQTLKDKLCNVPFLALPDGPKDFVAIENSREELNNSDLEFVRSCLHLRSGDNYPE
ncbi:hypothetical protein Tco_0479502 [Tanacetum coccineum]